MKRQVPKGENPENMQTLQDQSNHYNGANKNLAVDTTNIINEEESSNQISAQSIKKLKELYQQSFGNEILLSIWIMF